MMLMVMCYTNPLTPCRISSCSCCNALLLLAEIPRTKSRPLSMGKVWFLGLGANPTVPFHPLPFPPLLLGATILLIFLRVNLPNFMQFKQYYSKILFMIKVFWGRGAKPPPNPFPETPPMPLTELCFMCLVWPIGRIFKIERMQKIALILHFWKIICFFSVVLLCNIRLQLLHGNI